ncbi:MAG TPA: hypothetical protein VN711_02730 [Candidatus Saccharimonadales bacterium]|nr:hypothetical protein [Candidatus Saccharimonadales bacterium]
MTKREDARLAMQRAAEAGGHGYGADPMEATERPGSKFGQAREKYRRMTLDEHAARKFGRNPKGFTPGAV